VKKQKEYHENKKTSMAIGDSCITIAPSDFNGKEEKGNKRP